MLTSSHVLGILGGPYLITADQKCTIERRVLVGRLHTYLSISNNMLLGLACQETNNAKNNMAIDSSRPSAAVDRHTLPPIKTAQRKCLERMRIELAVQNSKDNWELNFPFF